MSMTEEGPSGDYKMTMQRDRHGRWMPTKGERTMNIQKGGETKLLRRRKPGTRNLFDCVGQGEHTAWIILSQSTERRRGILETPFCRRANAVFESDRNRMARSTRFQGGDNHRLHASGCDQRKHSERVISSRLVLRWKETGAAVVAAREMGFPHPLRLPPPRLRDQVLRQDLVLCARWLRMFSAVPRAPHRPCRAISAQIALRGWRLLRLSLSPADGKALRCATVLLWQSLLLNVFCHRE